MDIHLREYPCYMLGPVKLKNNIFSSLTDAEKYGHMYYLRVHNWSKREDTWKIVLRVPPFCRWSDIYCTISYWSIQPFVVIGMKPYHAQPRFDEENKLYLVSLKGELTSKIYPTFFLHIFLHSWKLWHLSKFYRNRISFHEVIGILNLWYFSSDKNLFCFEQVSFHKIYNRRFEKFCRLSQ